MRPGDIIAFSGRGRFADLIRISTGSNISHVGIVCHSLVRGIAAPVIELWESVKHGICWETGRPIAGMIRRRLSDVIAHTDAQMWLCPLGVTAHNNYNERLGAEFLMSVRGQPYDMPQALIAGLSKIASSRERAMHAVEDYSAFFCSELAAAAYIAGGALGPDVKPGELTPACLLSIPGLFAPTAYQIKGAPDNIILNNNTQES